METKFLLNFQSISSVELKPIAPEEVS